MIQLEGLNDHACRGVDGANPEARTRQQRLKRPGRSRSRARGCSPVSCVRPDRVPACRAHNRRSAALDRSPARTLRPPHRMGSYLCGNGVCVRRTSSARSPSRNAPTWFDSRDVDELRRYPIVTARPCAFNAVRPQRKELCIHYSAIRGTHRLGGGRSLQTTDRRSRPRWSRTILPYLVGSQQAREPQGPGGLLIRPSVAI